MKLLFKFFFSLFFLQKKSYLQKYKYFFFFLNFQSKKNNNLLDTPNNTVVNIHMCLLAAPKKGSFMFVSNCCILLATAPQASRGSVFKRTKGDQKNSVNQDLNLKIKQPRTSTVRKGIEIENPISSVVKLKTKKPFM